MGIHGCKKNGEVEFKDRVFQGNRLWVLEASGKYWLGNKPSRWFRNLTVWWGNPTRRREASPRNPGPSALLRPGQHPAAVRAAPGSRSPPETVGKRGGALGHRGYAHSAEPAVPHPRGGGAHVPALFPGRSRPEAVEGAARPRKSQVRRSGIRIRWHPRSAVVSGPGGWPSRQGPRVAERGRGRWASPLPGRRHPGPPSYRAGPWESGALGPEAATLPPPRPRSPGEERGPPGKGRGRGRGSPSPRRPGVRGRRRSAESWSLLAGLRAAGGRVPGGEGRVAKVPRRAALSPAAVPDPAAPASFTRSGYDGAQVEAFRGAQVRLRSLLTAETRLPGLGFPTRAQKWDRVRTRICPGLSLPAPRAWPLSPGWASRPLNLYK